ncbi:unnamed protein product [Penicillium salamii]|uniref:Ferredoxin n=1 Tax=Penicillium salamii TaxID=1612424 RepID=A0A9W4JH00_9EURO|nr:unnamed protein product [Penicillium salamii]CAG8245237.1 unnamed protein product [Penicillium salamii]CAG8399018.1 unnamed protein product [Penicillium salamii]
MATYTITFTSPSDSTPHSFECDEDMFLLDAAEQAGFEWPYASRQGADSSSVARLISGEVDQSEQIFLDDDQIKAGFIQTDSSYPKSDLVIITHQEDQLY